MRNKLFPQKQNKQAKKEVATNYQEEPQKKQNEIIRVLTEKRKATKRIRQKKQGALQDIKHNAIYRSRMSNQLDLLKDLFEDSTVQGFIVTVDDKDLTSFLQVIHEEEMLVYDVTQLNANTFEIAKKAILM